MDGGRVSRAILARRLGHARGTQIALRVGQALAFAFGLAGLLGGAPDLTRAMVAYAHALRGALRGPDVTAELERLLTPDLAASRGGPVVPDPAAVQKPMLFGYFSKDLAPGFAGRSGPLRQHDAGPVSACRIN
jgi:hypothetical protein